MLDSWTYTNATASANSKVESADVSVPGTETKEIFPGGFAPHCEAGTQLKYLSGEVRWECSGAVNWNQKVFLPGAKDSADILIKQDGTATVGMFIMPHVVRKSTAIGVTDSFAEMQVKDAPDQTNNLDEGKVQEIRATCWTGDTPPSDYSTGYESKWFSVKIQSIPDDRTDPVPIYGTLDFEANNANRFTCRWGLLDGEGDFHTGLGGTDSMTGSEFVDRFDTGYTYSEPEDPNIGKSLFKESVMSSDVFKEFADNWRNGVNYYPENTEYAGLTG